MPGDLQHFGFGKNWERLVKRHYSDERVSVAQAHLLNFLQMQDLKDKHFLDVGCGSGLHSLAAFRAGARRIVSFDYDQAAVNTTFKLREMAGNPSLWEIRQGSVLDPQFLSTIERADIVYSWGVLHHTGAMWQALENAARLMNDSAVLYIALYTSGVVKPSDEFWLEIKQRYNRANWAGRREMELSYVWEFLLHKKISALPGLIRVISGYGGRLRGMEFYTNVVDWLGGWPMEFAKIEDVKQFSTDKLGLKLINIATGEANTSIFSERADRLTKPRRYRETGAYREITISRKALSLTARPT